MKTTQNIRNKTLFAALAIFLGITCTKVHSQTVYSVNIVGCVPDMTIELLTAPLTVAQRQVLHAQNFNQLPPSARAYYLHAVAYATGLEVASDGWNGEQDTMLRQHLESLSSIYEVPAIPSEDSQSLQEFLSVVHTTMKQLNLLISTQVVNNPGYQQAMHAAAVHSFYDWDWWW